MAVLLTESIILLVQIDLFIYCFLIRLLKKFVISDMKTGLCSLLFVLLCGIQYLLMCARPASRPAEHDIVSLLGAELLLWYACVRNSPPYDFWAKKV